MTDTVAVALISAIASTVAAIASLIATFFSRPSKVRESVKQAIVEDRNGG